MKTTRHILAATLFICLRTAQCPAQPAYVLDPDFKPAVSNPSPRSMIPLGDGKLVLIGSFKTSDGSDCRGLARFQADGSLDTTFRPLCNAWLVRPTLGADGMILVVVVVFDNASDQYRSRLLRLKPDASQDAVLPAPDWLVADFAEDLNNDDFVFTGRDGEYQRIGRDGKTKAVAGGIGSWSGFHAVAVSVQGTLQAFGGSDKGQGEYPPGLLLRRYDGSVSRTYPVLAVQSLVVFGGESILVAGDGMLQMFSLNGLPVREFSPRFSDWVYSAFRLGDSAGRVIVHGNFDHVNGQKRRRVAILNLDGSVGPEFGPAERGELDGQESSLEFVSGSQGDLFAVGYLHPEAQESSLVRFRALPVWRYSAFDATGRFTGTIGCLTGWKYRVEASADLKQWDTVANGTNASESVPFSDTAPPGTARRFYRVVKE